MHKGKHNILMFRPAEHLYSSGPVPRSTWTSVQCMPSVLVRQLQLSRWYPLLNHQITTTHSGWNNVFSFSRQKTCKRRTLELSRSQSLGTARAMMHSSIHSAGSAERYGTYMKTTIATRALWLHMPPPHFPVLERSIDSRP